MPRKRLNKHERDEILADYSEFRNMRLSENAKAALVNMLSSPQGNRDEIAAALRHEWDQVGDDLRTAMGMKPKHKGKKRRL